jgi:hypothetical protein
MIRDRDAQVEEPARGAVARLAIVERTHGGLDDVGRGGEIRLADLDVENLPALPLELFGTREHVERTFGAKVVDARGERDVHGGWSGGRHETVELTGTDAKNPGGKPP